MAVGGAGSEFVNFVDFSGQISPPSDHVEQKLMDEMGLVLPRQLRSRICPKIMAKKAVFLANYATSG